jgi:putative glycosyltransferase (TIGR04372 family)
VIALSDNQKGFSSLWHKIRSRNLKELFHLAWVNFIGLFIVCFLAVINPFRPVQLLEIRSRAIGQQAGNTGLFLRRLQLENKNARSPVFYIGISGKPDNQQLLTMFRRKIFIVQSDFLSRVCGNGAFFIRWSGFYKELPFSSNEFSEFSDTIPDLQFTPAEEEEGKKLLKNMGIGDKSWFVCFHCRDAAFSYSYAGDFRNSDIKEYLEAADYITSCGGFALRMGQTVAEKLPHHGNPRIIDYACNFRTDFGDIYLPAKCKFFLGSTAGLFFISTLFNVPVAGANFIPFYTPLRKGDLFLPKKIWSVNEERFLTFREYIEFSGEIRGGNIRQGVDSNIYVSDKLAGGKYRVVDNTGEEILELAREINERLDGTFKVTDEDEELQNQFRSLLHPDDFLYGTPARIGAKFLRENRDLLG